MRFTNHSNKLLLKLFKFLIAGGGGFATNIFVLYFLTDIFHVWYLTSSIIAFITSLGVSFILHKFFTFENHSLDNLHWQGGAFLVLSLCNLTANTLIMYVGVTAVGLNHLLTQVGASALIAIWTFFILNHLFRKSSII